MIYYLGITLFKLFYRVFYGLKIIGVENIPTQGGVILAANHVSWQDPLILAAGSPRTVHFLAKRELFRFPFGPLFHGLKAIPITRGESDRGAIRKCLEILQQGKILGLFPEGTRNKGDQLLPAQRGVSFMALKSGVTLIPVGIVGTHPQHKLVKRPKLVVSFGKPIPYQAITHGPIAKEEHQKITDKVMDGIRFQLQICERGRI
jgi:1-acyl-sn-glycerol-3-phosphate acyltransferase